MSATSTTSSATSSTRVKKASVQVAEQLEETCRELQSLQRHRAIIIKSRNMQTQRLLAVVAGDIWCEQQATGANVTAASPQVNGQAGNGRPAGWSAEGKVDKATWKRLYEEAASLVKEVMAGTREHRMSPIIRTTYIGVGAFEEIKGQLEKSMRNLAKTLPVAEWAELPEQSGFGLLSLATLIGETGNLSNYPNPAKVWRRMGCAPWTFDGRTLMGATWKSGNDGEDKIKLPSSEWEKFGYNPRRRSIAYIIGENLVKQNKTGPYRTLYLQAKVHVNQTHPEWDWSDCDKCVKVGKPPRDCLTCGGCAQKSLRANRHAMLVATKRLMRNLWRVWWGQLGDEDRANRGYYLEDYKKKSGKS